MYHFLYNWNFFPSIFSISFFFLLFVRNPFYGNTRKTIEPHLLHVFEKDFYDEELRLVVLGYLRPESGFPSLDALIAAIHADIANARNELESTHAQSFISHDFLIPKLC